MSAKPQPMAGQPDAADDLIAELAKLMAQDAQGDKPVVTPKPETPVRIPGGESQPAVSPVPRFDFSKPAEAPAAVAPQAAKPTPAAPVDNAAEPFRFDFDLNTPRRPAAPAPAAPAPRAAEPVRPAAPAPVPTPAPQPVVAAPVDEHDSIADLIAAELAAEPPTVAAKPAAAPVTEARSPTPRVESWAPANPSAEARPAAPEPEQAVDRFRIPPVFGLGTKPAAPAPSEPTMAPPRAEPTLAAPVKRPEPPIRASDDKVGTDPIDEIESLIGRAMRVEFDKPDDESDEVAPVAAAPVASPALRSLATPTLAPQPQQVEPRSEQPQRTLSPADEAILAAAQASGAEIGWVENPETLDEAEPRERPVRGPRVRGFSRALAGPLVAVTLLLAAGFGLYWVLGLGRDAGPAPLLTADATPVKETPAPQPDSVAAQQSVVFNEIAGVVPGAEEQLVSRDQADLNEVTQVPPADISEEGLANRKVRTLTVRPDGSIVSGDDSVAGSTILPVDRPNVPAVPGAESAAPTLLANAEPVAETPAPTPTPVVTPEPAPAVTPVQPGSTVAVVDAAGNAVPGKTAPVPLQRPAFSSAAIAAASQPTSPVNAVVDTPVSTGQTLPPPPTAAATQPVAQPQPTAVEGTLSSAPAYVQLSSQRTEEAARSTAQDIANRFGPLFNGASLEVQRVDLGARGIFYRVRVPANSVQEANTLCANVKSSGGDCFTM